MHVLKITAFLAVETRTPPLFLTHYSQLHTNVCGKTIENLLLQVISIDLLFLSDITLFPVIIQSVLVVTKGV